MTDPEVMPSTGTPQGPNSDNVEIPGRVVVVTGLSGAGRSTAADALEDLGWFVIDNLPPALIPKIAELAGSGQGTYGEVALIMGGDPEGRLSSLLDELRGAAARVEVVFLEAANDVLHRRYELTRRKHPWATDGVSVPTAIEMERDRLAAVRAGADLVLDTTDLNPHQLRERLTDQFSDDAGPSLRLTVMSFGFKHGHPRDADMVIDVRFLPNPHWDDDLRPFTGLDEPVRAHVLDRPHSEAFLGSLLALLDEVLPPTAAEGRSYFTVAVGCTGGRHRSVAVSEAVAAALTDRGWQPRVTHRDLER